MDGKFAAVPQLPDGVTVVRKVVKNKPVVHWCLINGAGEKLEETTLPGELIPVVMVYGERRMVDGKRDFRGMVRMAKDPSRMEDFCESSLMEAISHAKTAPWLAEYDQISEFQQMWNRANTSPPPVLFYKRVSDNGSLLPPPQRVSSSVDVSALTLAAQRMQNHVRNVTGNADVFQEEQRPEQSGRAILARKQQQELGTSDYMENLADGIVLTGKIIMGMARVVYDTPQLLRIIGADEKELEIVTHAGQDQAGQAQQLMQQSTGVKGMLDVSVGEYDITVGAARSYQTARQEAVDAISQLPEDIIKVGADVYVGNMDFPGAQEFAARLKKMNPAAQDEDESPIPPQVQQQMQQAQQVIDEQTRIINEMKQQMEAKRADLESRERVAGADAEARIAIEQMKAQAAVALAATKAEAAEREAAMSNMVKLAIAELQAKTADAHEHAEAVRADMGRAHEADMAERQAATTTEPGE